MSGINGTQAKKLVLVGNPNVGKSVLFRLLTGRYAMVSNFPGTTVEVARGQMHLGGTDYEVIDTPGINSLVPQSEEERVACEILLEEKPDVILQVADGKNLRRTLLVTSQLVEFGIPMVLVLNMMDEVEDRGIEIDTRGITDLFEIPLVETVAIYRHGTKQLLRAIESARLPQNPLRNGRWAVDSLTALNGDRGPFRLAIEWLGYGERSCIRRAEQSLGHAFVSRLMETTGKPLGHGGQGDCTEGPHRRCVVETARRAVSTTSRHSADAPSDDRAVAPWFISATERSHAARLAGEIARRRNEFLDWAVERFKKKRKKEVIEASADPGTRVWLALLALGILIFAWNEIGGLFHTRTPYSWTSDFITERLARPSESVFSSRDLGVLHSILFAEDAEGKSRYGVAYELNHFFLIIFPVLLPFAVLLKKSRAFAEKTGVLTRLPSTGIPILLVVLLLIYEFVGYTGAQTLVGLIEEGIFGRHLIPLLQSWIPLGFLFDLLVGKYGLVSMGLTYSIAIVFPVVTTFFLAFSLLEDSGYLPRLTVLTDRVMRCMGLNGKATLPMVLGLGCCTMATMTTRILSTKKERLIATLLLALGVPCSAQLGVILGIASGFSVKATLTIIGVVVLQLFLVGYLASKLIRGERSGFIFEVPPIRVPQLRNVALKTGYRIQWYLKEAVPLFLYGTFALFVLDKWHLSGKSLLERLQSGLEPVIVGLLHLPREAASIFVLGFLRRDYGAAGLFDMVRSGALSAQQAVVSLIVITLFVPCLASFLVIVKEHGLRKALAITGFIVPYAIAVGGIVSWTLRTFEITFR